MLFVGYMNHKKQDVFCIIQKKYMDKEGNWRMLD